MKDTYSVTIEKLVSGGDGLAHLPDGRVVFVPLSIAGERCTIQLDRQKKDYAVGRIVDMIEPSPARIQARCPHYGLCGGCQLQHVTYEEEIRVKGQFLADTLSRQAKLDLEPEEFYPSSQEWGYRTKSEHPVSTHRSYPLVGYYQRHSHKVVNVDSCAVLHPQCVDDLCRIRKILGESEESIYHEARDRGNLRHVVLRRATDGSRLAGLVIRQSELNPQTIRGLLENLSGLSGIVVNYNPNTGNRIMGEKTEVISGQGHLVEEIGGLRFRVSFTSFFQANHEQAQRLVDLLIDFLVPQQTDTVCDTYSGVGMMGLSLAKSVKKVIAIESNSSSYKDGEHNSEINELFNVTWIKSETGKSLPGIEYDKLILDPPRKGLDDRTISAVLSSKPRVIAYVSCNPSTWARDVRHLIEAGYELTRLAWLDMFPKTAHLELISLLEFK